MADRDLSVLEQYECKVYGMTRGRGAFICETNMGPVLLREFTGKEERISGRIRLLESLREQGLLVDFYIKNKAGTYISKSEDGTTYTLSSWFYGRECDTKCFADVCHALRGLARLHNYLDSYTAEEGEFQIARSLIKEYDKHNKEMKMIRNYLSDKHKKSDFELLAASKCQEFLEEGEAAAEILKNSGYVEAYEAAAVEKRLCHGDFNYHNIFFEEENCAICGFEQTCINLCLIDLYEFMRKLMEKYDWDVKLGFLMLREYDSIRPLASKDVKLLGAMLSYPEKYWKILNYYFNANKAWIPVKNYEKLKLAVNQNRMRKEFVKTLI